MARSRTLLLALLAPALVLAGCSSSPSASQDASPETAAPSTTEGAPATTVAPAPLVVRPVLQAAVLDDPSTPPQPAETAPGTAVVTGRAGYVYLVGPAAAEADIFEPGAEVTRQSIDGVTRWVVILSVRSDDASMAAWTALTETCSAATATCPNGQIALIVGDQALSAPRVPADIDLSLGTFTISGDFTEAEARALAADLSRA